MQKARWKLASEKQPARRTRWLIAAILSLVAIACVGGIAGWRYAYPPEDPQVAKVKALQQQVVRSFQAEGAAPQRSSATGATATNSAPALSEKEREAAMAQLRTEMEKLTEEQRDLVRREMGNSFRDRMQATIAEYRALPKEKRTAFLDRQIDQMEQRRAQFERGGNRGPARGSSPGSTNGGNQAPGSSGNRNAAASASRPGGDRGPPSTERRLSWRRNMLAETTPQERAEAEMYFSDLNARRQERGLEPFGPRGRR